VIVRRVRIQVGGPVGRDLEMLAGNGEIDADPALLVRSATRRLELALECTRSAVDAERVAGRGFMMLRIRLRGGQTTGAG
jgi:hypothetical protein